MAHDVDSEIRLDGVLFTITVRGTLDGPSSGTPLQYLESQVAGMNDFGK